MPTGAKLRSFRKELAMSATAASQGDSPRVTSSSIYVTTTCSSAAVRFRELGIVLTREGRPARRSCSVVLATL
jgi:hypothetical protein